MDQTSYEYLDVFLEGGDRAAREVLDHLTQASGMDRLQIRDVLGVVDIRSKPQLKLKGTRFILRILKGQRESVSELLASLRTQKK